MPTNPLIAGGTTAHSTGWGITNDISSVRHEQSRADQTKRMVNEPYTPVQRMKPRTAAETTAHLLVEPKAVAEHLQLMRSKIEQMTNPAEAKKHSLQSKFKRAGATIISAPDAGNVTDNMVKALQISKPAPKKLQKKSLQRPAPVAAYPASAQNEELLSLHRDLKDVRQLKQRVAHMIQLFNNALADGQAMRTATLPQAERDYHRALLTAATKDVDGPRKMLQEACEQYAEIANDIKQAKKHIEARASDSSDDATPGAAGSSKAAGKKADPFLMELAGLEKSLELPAMQRRIATGVVASLTRNPPTGDLQQLEKVLTRLEADRAKSISEGNQALQLAHKAEIDDLLEKLPHLGRFSDKDAVRQFIRTGLGQVKLDGSYDVTGKDTPPPMMARVFMRALAGVTARTPGAALDSKLLNQTTLEATYNEIKSLAGGVAMHEQITGKKIEAGVARVAQRVDGLAQASLNRLAATPAGASAAAASQPRRKVLTKASDAARKLFNAKGKMTVDSLSESTRASFRAVRNDFFTSKDEGTGIDPNMQSCNDHLVKLQTDLITNTTRKHPVRSLLSVTEGKTPLAEKALDLAALTSTLGYDDESRPQLRLDKNLSAATKHLRSLVSEDALNAISEDETSGKAMASLGKTVANIDKASLSAEQVLRLAGILTAEKAARKSVEKLRPGHVTLELKDASMFVAELEKLVKLHKPGEGTLDRDAIKQFITDHGRHVANPYALVDLVDSLHPHIAATHINGEENTVRKQLLSEVNVIRHLTSAEEITSIKSTKDLYLFLKPKLQQFELRGKLKMSAGGNVGISTKSLTWPVDLDPGALSVVLPIRPVAGSNKVRCAVVEFGFSTYAMEMLVGSEDRTIYNAGAGLGVRVGYESLLSSGAGVDRSVTYERSDTKGLWMRVPRGKDDDLARVEMDKALQTLLGVDGNGDPVDGNNHLTGHLLDDDGGVLMPKLMGKLLAENDNLSLSSIGVMREESVRHESNPNASILTIAGGSGDDASRVQIGAAGVRSDRRTKSFRQEDKTGFLKVTRSNNFSGGSVWEQESLLAVNGLFNLSSDASTSENYGALNRQKQHPEKGVDVKMRHIEVDGETNAVNSRIDIEDVNFDNHLKRVEGLKPDLIALGAEQLFAGDKSAPEAYEQGFVAEDLLYQRLKQSEEKSETNSRHVHSISFCVEPSAARRKDAYNAMSELEQRHGDPVQASLYKRQGNEVLQHPQSTKPWKVTTSERTSENRQFGWTSGFTVARLWRTEGQRGTSSYPK